MLRRVSATPCPIPTSIDLTTRRDSIYDTTTTLNLDFTTDFTRANLLTAVKPRRRQTSVRKDIVIHEDQPEEPRQCGPSKTANINQGGVLLAQPAKRLRGRVSFAGDARFCATQDAQVLQKPLGSIAEIQTQTDRRLVAPQMSQLPTTRTSATRRSILKNPMEDTQTKSSVDGIHNDRKLTKPPRRGTIYIPPDDTTMPSMYMGIFSPIKDIQRENIEPQQDSSLKITGLTADLVKRRGRRSSLAAEPARRIGPIRPVLGTVNEQDSCTKMNLRQDIDRAGAETGKENLPPGFHRRDVTVDVKSWSMSKGPLKNAENFTKPPQRRQSSFAVTAPTSSRPFPGQHKPAWNSGTTSVARRVSITAPAPRQTHLTSQQTKEPKQLTILPKVPSRFVVPRLHKEDQPSQQFPPLVEDINNTALYEDSWLSHQEIGITQLLNNLFSAANSKDVIEPDLLRFDMLDAYQSSQFVLLHKRLQGAILYGALRVPEHILSDAKRLQNDLGVRKAYVDLWVKSYDRIALKAALEVVVGRQCSSSVKDITTFIEVFLIRNDDSGPDFESKDHAAWSYRRTILRSLMVIKLLDYMKTQATSTLTNPLLLSASPLKSSPEVLQSLIQLLNPSMGQRALIHLQYSVEHKQHPLEEYEYEITNLAIDLRDGVRLTRLVELLLYPSASQNLARAAPDDTMMTLNMPTGEVLSMHDIEAPTQSTQYPLSQHLKFPCESRVVKLFNVQIALSALQQVKSMCGIIEDICAEDIVDGFREKTVAILWGLTGKWGLGGLIDWKDVRSEIARFQRRKREDDSDLLDDEELDDLSQTFTGHKALLKAWAGGVASTKRLKVNNLTTSFADGRVFEAIVDEYERYLSLKGTASPTSRKAALNERLIRLGCSVQFSSLFAGSFTGNKYHIFDRDFTLAALAFLCSRLLSATKRSRAGIVIQRTWQNYRLRRYLHKRKMARMLAGQCAEVVNTRERLLNSKRTILKAWRNYKEREQMKQLGIYHDDTNSEATDLWLNL